MENPETTQNRTYDPVRRATVVASIMVPLGLLLRRGSTYPNEIFPTGDSRLPECFSSCNCSEALIRDRYPEPIQPAADYVKIVEGDGEKYYLIRSNQKERGREYSLQNTLDWIAQEVGDSGEKITKVVLETGVHYTNGIPIVLDKRHSGLSIEGQDGAVINAEFRSRCFYVDGANRQQKTVEITFKNIKFVNGHSGRELDNCLIARSDKYYSLWNLVDGGCMVVQGKAKVDIDGCTFMNFTSLICGGCLSFDTAYTTLEQSTITNCYFENCGLVPSGLGTGEVIDVLSGNVLVDNCQFRDCGVENAKTVNDGKSGLICAFGNSFVAVQNCTIELVNEKQAAITFTSGKKGVLVVGKGNKIILPRGVGLEKVDINEILCKVRQLGPSEEEARILADYGFQKGPNNAWGEELTARNPGVVHSGTIWLGRRDIPAKILFIARFAGLNQGFVRYEVTGDNPMTVFVQSPIFEFENSK